MATMTTAPGQPKNGLGGMVKLIVGSFLEQRHYRQLHEVLGEQWSSCHSLTAAVRLMEAHGVRVSPEEEKRLAALPEERMIDALVMRMPEQSREQFEHFFLQLSFIASTTTRLRSAIELGQTEVVEEALESAENVGVLPYLMKMATAQAGQEAKGAATDHDDWLGLTDNRMSPLLQSQATAMVTKKALAQAKAQLGMDRNEASEKTKKVLLGLASGNEHALIAGSFLNWHNFVVRQKRENEIRAEYEDEIMEAEKRLMKFKEKQLETVRNVLVRGAQGQTDRLIHTCWDAFVEEVNEKKRLVEDGAKIKELEEKLKGYAEAASSNAKKVLTRMNAGNEEGLVHMCLNAWMQFIADYNKDREMNNAVKDKEKMVAEFMKKQNDGAKSVLNRMSSGSDAAMIQQFFQAWRECWEEDKQATKFQAELEAKSSRFGAFGDRNKNSAMSASQKAAYIFDMGYVIVTFCRWKTDVKIDSVRRRGKEKNMKRKQELIGVKGLFKNFASELETSLKETPRVEDKKAASGAAGAAPAPKKERSNSQSASGRGSAPAPAAA